MLYFETIPTLSTYLLLSLVMVDPNMTINRRSHTLSDRLGPTISSHQEMESSLACPSDACGFSSPAIY